MTQSNYSLNTIFHQAQPQLVKRRKRIFIRIPSIDIKSVSYLTLPCDHNRGNFVMKSEETVGQQI